VALRVEYFLGEAFSSLRRNLLMTLAAIMTVSVSLFLLGGVMVLSEMVGRTVQGVESQVQVQAFLREDITPDQTRDLQALIAGMPEQKDFKYVSKEEAFKEFTDINKETPALTENIDPEALPTSYRIELHEATQAEAVTTRLEGQPGVEDVKFGGEDAKKLISLMGLIRRGVVVAVAFILGAAVLLIANTIRLAIYARRREIAIMKLVGATNWFVRVPFIFEGMAEGALGALLAGSIIFGSKFLLLDKLQESIVFIPLTVGVDSLFRILALLVVVGMFVGAIGSGLALRRFLEV
jgi:cell division transport system permease protein